MDGVTLVLRSLHHVESGLARDLLRTAQRHAADHEVYHGATDLARWSREHAARLAEAAKPWDLELSEEPGSPDGPLATLREKAGYLLGHRPEPALLLLHDLRGLHLAASDASLHWEMLAQSAQALRHDGLLELATSCHPQSLRQMRWSNTLVKELAAQTITSL
jgi:hypothetical protein